MRLSESYELVWGGAAGRTGPTTYLPNLLGLLPQLAAPDLQTAPPRFRLGATGSSGPLGRVTAGGRGDGLDRRQTFDESCYEWGAPSRPEPTLLVPTEPQVRSGSRDGPRPKPLAAWACAVASEREVPGKSPDNTGYTEPGDPGSGPIFFLIVVSEDPGLVGVASGFVWCGRVKAA